MHPNPTVDTLSPWYEAFAPRSQSQPHALLFAAAEQPASTPAVELPATDWATEALFDYYND